MAGLTRGGGWCLRVWKNHPAAEEAGSSPFRRLEATPMSATRDPSRAGTAAATTCVEAG